jgi:sarcosine oxidase subunit gamma
MRNLERRSALDAHQLEHRTRGLHMRESALAVLGLRLLRGEPANLLESRIEGALPASINRASAFGEGWVLGVEPNVWRVYALRERHLLLLRALADLPATAGLAGDLSSRFCTLELTGPSARRVIASGCPIDLHPKSFGTGYAASSSLLGNPVLIVKTSGAPSFLLSCERACAPVVWDWLAAADEHATVAEQDAERAS